MKTPFFKSFTTILTVLVISALLGWLGWWGYSRLNTEETITEYIGQKPGRGPMKKTISATGTVEPEELIRVGTRVGGEIKELGLDAGGKPIDYSSVVKKGQVLARIDDSLYQAQKISAVAQVAQAAASLESARAGVLQADAKVREAQASRQKCQAQLKLAQQNYDRAKNLHTINAQRDLEEAESNLEVARASLSVADASLASAQASVAAAKSSVSESEARIEAAKAALKQAEDNLEYCTITSPEDGVIIDRRVSIGQTVNASMNTPTLFLIARDMKKMEVWVSVNEADIGEIKEHAKHAQFTVDAFPMVSFSGVVSNIRQNATMSQNVVTYVVEISTDNSNMKLLPYLTANVNFILDSREDAVYVPNSAFRVAPQGAAVPELKPGERVIWIWKGARNTPEPLVVTTGLNDGSSTEITSGNLTGDMMIVTAVRTVAPDEPEDGPAGSASPFMPKPPQHGGPKK